ncbi:MAG: GGDEF domain-containing protein [Gammaproteobacteria bacterium]|nr:GGDEF domain-containing protein [Gammaproteobacteria bacterium]
MNLGKDTVLLKAATLRKIMRLLDGLSASDSGHILLSQIGHMLASHEDACCAREHTLVASIGFLLDAISTHLPADTKLQTKISLLRARMTPPLDEVEMDAIREAVEQCADEITLVEGAVEQQVRTMLKPLLEAYGMSETPGSTTSEDINTRGKIHYLQKRSVAETRSKVTDEVKNGVVSKGMNMVMDSLTAHEKIVEGLNKSREFGKLLETELETIRDIDHLNEFDKRKQALVHELENVLQDHQQLVENFQTVSSYLAMVQHEGKRLSEELNRVTTLSLTDDLTALPNRRAFIKRLKDEISRAQRYGNSLALAILDLDRFKPINDNYGHPAGDAVLKCYSQDVLTTFRHNDMVARYGGEEFAVIFPNTAVEGAYKALQKVLKRANETTLQFEGNNIRLPGFSSGLVVFEPGESLDALIGRADNALYTAKKDGRNRINMALSESAIAE